MRRLQPRRLAVSVAFAYAALAIPAGKAVASSYGPGPYDAWTVETTTQLVMVGQAPQFTLPLVSSSGQHATLTVGVRPIAGSLAEEGLLKWGSESASVLLLDEQGASSSFNTPLQCVRKGFHGLMCGLYELKAGQIVRTRTK